MCLDCDSAEERHTVAYRGEPAKYVLSILLPLSPFSSPSISHITHSHVTFTFYHAVYELPQDLFDKLEKAAASHPPKRTVNPSKALGLGYDLFDEGWPFEK